MEWTYRIRAAARPRTLMRIAQVFDQQMVSMRRCLLEETGDVVEMAITVETEEALAVRIHAKLYKLLDLHQVDLVAGPSRIGG